MSAALFMICGVASAQMTDDQIIEYVQSAMASGKDENQIAQELVYRGVTRSQLERLRDRYQGQQSGSSGSSYGAGYSTSGRTLSSLADKDGYIDYGNGKGNPEYWVALVQPGRVIYEMDGVDEQLAREAFALAAAKLPLKTKFVVRQIGM